MEIHLRADFAAARWLGWPAFWLVKPARMVGRCVEWRGVESRHGYRDVGAYWLARVLMNCSTRLRGRMQMGLRTEQGRVASGYGGAGAR